MSLNLCTIKQKSDENLVDSTGVNDPLEEKEKLIAWWIKMKAS